MNVPSPEEIRSPKFGRTFRGYDVPAVDQLLGRVAQSVEELAAERDGLRGRVAKLEDVVGEQGQTQRLLNEALVTAQRAAEDMKQRTQRECDELLEQARVQAREIEQGAQIEREHTVAELDRLRAQERELRASYRVLLAAALERLEEPAGKDDLPQATLLDALAPRRITAPASGSSDQS